MYISKLAPQPLKEEYLLTGPLEITNEPYAIAKIAGIKMCEAYCEQYGSNFISAMPTNLYGPNDNYDLQYSHVLPALIRKIHEAKVNNKKSITLCGTGSPLREFMHVDDLADALLFLMKDYNDPQFVNVGSGQELSILDLAFFVKKIIEYTGVFDHDLAKPDGTPRKLMDSSKIMKLGWRPSIALEEGIKSVYNKLLESGDLN